MYCDSKNRIALHSSSPQTNITLAVYIVSGNSSSPQTNITLAVYIVSGNNSISNFSFFVLLKLRGGGDTFGGALKIPYPLFVPKSLRSGIFV